MRRLSLVLLPLLLAACTAAPQLMPTPNLYTTPGNHPFTDVPPALQSNTVDVLYLTDRAPLSNPNDPRRYGYQRSRSLAFGISTVQFGNNLSWPKLVEASTSRLRTVDLPVTVTKTTELARFQPTPPSILNVPGSAAALKDDADQLNAETAFRQTLSSMLAKSPVKDVYLSVHGVNNLHEHSVSRIAEIWHFLGRQGVPIAYSWPAGSPGLKQYMVDRESSEFTVYHFKQTLKLIASCPDVHRVHIIGHSRGTDVVASALRELHIEYATAGKSTRDELKLGTLVLAAPDMDTQVVLQRSGTAQIGLDPERFALYVGDEDKLLKISNWLFGGLARLGDSSISSLFDPAELKALRERGTPQVIDSRISDTGSFGHDYFVSNPAVSSDLILLMRYHLPPGLQRPLATDPSSNFYLITNSYPWSTPLP